jgi:hypothetical protein
MARNIGGDEADGVDAVGGAVLEQLGRESESTRVGIEGDAESRPGIDLGPERGDGRGAREDVPGHGDVVVAEHAIDWLLDHHARGLRARQPNVEPHPHDRVVGIAVTPERGILHHQDARPRPEHVADPVGIGGQ